MRFVHCWPFAQFMTIALGIGLILTQARAASSQNVVCGTEATSRSSTSMGLSAAIQYVACQSMDKRLVIIGESHGSNENPALVSALVDAVSKDRPVRVGLEWPAWMQDYVAAYLSSRGTLDDREAMLRMGYWRVARDGRGSKAMVALIDSIRLLRRQGRDIDVFMMEPDVPTSPSDLKSDMLTWKENGMAKALKAAVNKAPSSALIVALMGNVHSRYVERADHPQASVLLQMIDNHPLYLATQADAGSLWDCDTNFDCGVHMFKSPPESPSADVEIAALTEAPSGITAETFRFPVFTPSVPSPRVEDKAEKASN
jgi:hypothetical protein